MDVHAASMVVVPMMDGAKPQPPQAFKPADVLAWVQKQQSQAKEIINCYEAGPTGFWTPGGRSAARSARSPVKRSDVQGSIEWKGPVWGVGCRIGCGRIGPV
jgi:hypothetical protein